MARVALTGGAYTAASIIANAQRSFNLYAERNGKDDAPPVPVTHYPCPGLSLLTTGEGQMWRGLYFSTSGVLFGVLDNKLYRITSSWTLSLLGVVGGGNTPVSMFDNGIDLVLVTGSLGFTVNLTTMTFAQITDPGFLGADKVDYLDTFLLFNEPGTKNFYCSLSNTVTFDTTYIAAKTSRPDLLQTLIVNKREIILIGQRTSEIWYNEGNIAFPFASLPGAFIEQGCIAKYSAVKHDLRTFWIARNKDGTGIAIMAEGYEAKRITTSAIESAWAEYETLSDAIGMTYQQRGHIFYLITFPTADKTWVFDVSTGMWHERGWIDSDGKEHRHRANCMTFAYDQIVIGDWDNGKLYAFSLEDFRDDEQTMSFIRGFPHILNDGNRVFYDSFVADVECGRPTANEPTAIFLRWSDDRGRTYLATMQQSFGDQGQYLSQPSWSRLGMARDRVFEVFWSTSMHTALNGAFIDVKESKS